MPLWVPTAIILNKVFWPFIDSLCKGQADNAYKMYVIRRTKHMEGERKQAEVARLVRERPYHEERFAGYRRRFIDPWNRRRRWKHRVLFLHCVVLVISVLAALNHMTIPQRVHERNEAARHEYVLGEISRADEKRMAAAEAARAEKQRYLDEGRQRYGDEWAREAYAKQQAEKKADDEKFYKDHGIAYFR